MDINRPFDTGIKPEWRSAIFKDSMGNGFIGPAYYRWRNGKLVAVVRKTKGPEVKWARLNRLLKGLSLDSTSSLATRMTLFLYHSLYRIVSNA